MSIQIDEHTLEHDVELPPNGNRIRVKRMVLPDGDGEGMLDIFLPAGELGVINTQYESAIARVKTPDAELELIRASKAK